METKAQNFGEKFKAVLTAEVAAGRLTVEQAKEFWTLNGLLGRELLKGAHRETL